ncbi:MAG: PAS domain S-box protein, partial [Bdellovibrionaceae bacterium]|nr:PAS domain S-box protein [Pseudobdellovibrionaceae bacterium]
MKKTRNYTCLLYLCLLDISSVLMFDDIKFFFENASFMPHGHCYLWRPDILWLNVISDFLITVSYYVIPFYLIFLVKKRKDLEFNWIVVMFAVFILSCGTTHLMDIITVWNPQYAIQGVIKFCTALVSMLTAFMLAPLIPKAIRLPSRSELDYSHQQLKTLNEKLVEANASLEEKVRLKTQDLSSLASIVEHSNDVIIQKNINDKIIFWNNASEKFYGYKAEEVMGKSIYDFIPLEKHQEFKEMMDRIYAGEKTESLETMRYNKEGQIVNVSIGISLIRDSFGKVIGSAHIIRDITAKKMVMTELKKSEDRFRRVIEAAPNGLVMVNSKGLIVLCNLQVEILFGIKREDLVGFPIEILIPERFRKNHSGFMKGFLGQPEARQMGVGRDLYGLRSDGAEFSIEIGLNPITIGDEIYILASIVDITKRKALEEQLRHYSKVMEQKNHEMEQFVYTVSHDLKSPLVTSTGFLGLLKEDLLSKKYEDLMDSINRLEKANHRMSQLIDDLLQISRIGRIKLDFDKIDLTTLINNICENLSAQLLEKKVEVEIEENMTLPFADKNRIYQVFENLIINALKY